MRRVLREELGGIRVTGIIPTIVLNDGLKSVFYCWIRKPVPGYAEAFIADDPDKYLQVSWEQGSYTYFAKAKYIKPSGIITVSLRSREVFKYGMFTIGTKLPPKHSNGPILWFGFEADDLFLGGVAHYAYSIDTGRLEAYVGNGMFVKYDLTEFLPGDYTENRHYYSIMYAGNTILHYIDGVVRAITILVDGCEPVSSIIYDGKPYKLGVAGFRPSPFLRVLLDIDGGDLLREWIWEDIHPWALRVLPGDSTTTLHTYLYRDPDGLPLKDMITLDRVVSTPIPGVGSKTVYFQVDNPGKLEIQALIGVDRWRVYDIMEIPKDKLLSYNITGNALAYRLVFEPTRTPTKIIDAAAFVSQ